MFQASILELQSQIQYHQQQIEEQEQKLDRLKMVSAFAEDATEKVVDALEHIEPKYLDVFKDHLLALFPPETPVYLEEKVKEEEEVPQEIIEEVEETQLPLTKEEQETSEPSGFEKIDSEITYNHVDSICYVAFSAKGRGDTYGSYLTRILDIGEKYTVSKDPQIVEGKYELRLESITFEDALHLQSFNLKKEWNSPVNKEARQLWRESRKREVPPACKPSPKLVPLAEIKLGDIVYLNSIDNQYKVLQKVELDGIPHLEVICVYNSERPSLVSEISYLKECYLVPSDSVQIDPRFSCSSQVRGTSCVEEREAKFKEQKEVLTEDVQIYVPKEKPVVKKSEELSEKDFPASPYNSIQITELEPADIITSTPYAKSAYEVIAVNKEYATAICLYHQALPGRVGEQYTFANPYLVEKASVSTEEKATEIPVAVRE